MNEDIIFAEAKSTIKAKMIALLYRLPSITSENHFGFRFVMPRRNYQDLHREVAAHPGEFLEYREGRDGKKVLHEVITGLPIHLDDEELDVVLECKPFPGCGGRLTLLDILDYR